jgi:hypothetical protein
MVKLTRNPKQIQLQIWSNFLQKRHDGTLANFERLYALTELLVVSEIWRRHSNVDLGSCDGSTAG